MNTQLTFAPLPLQGGINFRDLGGYLMTDGRRIRQNRLFRSGGLDQLTQQDTELLSRLPVTTILDYRDQEEARARPDRLWTGVNYHLVPANPLSSEISANFDLSTLKVLAELDVDAFMTRLYCQLPFANLAYQQLADLLISPSPGALIQHCTIGKDRTGIGSLLILLVLGADYDTVMEDYLYTETALLPFRDQTLEQYAEHLDSISINKLAQVFSVQETWLNSALDAIYQRYGTTDCWLEYEYGLDRQHREQVQAYYLEG